jgi:NADH:ubiquinone oxidoreductase subunit K
VAIVLSVLLLCLGLFGLTARRLGIIRMFIALESIVFAGIVNFGYSLHGRFTLGPHLAIIFALVTSCLTFCIVFVMLNSKLKECDVGPKTEA